MKRSLSTENTSGDLPPTVPIDDSNDHSEGSGSSERDDSNRDNNRCQKNVRHNVIQNIPLIPYGLFVSALIPIPEEQKLASDFAKYWMGELQVTIPHVDTIVDIEKIPYVESPIHPKYAGMLSCIGESLLRKILQRVSANDYDVTLEHYCTTSCHSGPHIPDNTSPFYSNKHFISLNSFDNICICGITDDETPIRTGYIVLYDTNWAWSSKGVLYRIISKHYSDYFTKYFDQ